MPSFPFALPNGLWVSGVVAVVHVQFHLLSDCIQLCVLC